MAMFKQSLAKLENATLIKNDTCPRSCTVGNYYGTSQDFAFDHNNTILLTIISLHHT